MVWKNLGLNLLRDLFFPPPVADATLPPVPVPPPNIPQDPEGGQCVGRVYNIAIFRTSDKTWLGGGSAIGPLSNFRAQQVSKTAFAVFADTGTGRRSIGPISDTGVTIAEFTPVNTAGFRIVDNLGRVDTEDRFVEITTGDGLPDNCGNPPPRLPPDGIGFPIVPNFKPLPIPLPPKLPVPVSPPPIFPVPPKLPPIIIPPVINPFDPAPLIGVEVNFNFDLTVNLPTVNINPPGTPPDCPPNEQIDWRIPFKQIQRLLHECLFRLNLILDNQETILRAVTGLYDRETLPYPGGELFTRRLGEVTFNTNGLITIPVPANEMLLSVELFVSRFAPVKGRRNRRGVTPLFSSRSFGFAALTSSIGAIGKVVEIRAINTSLPAVGDVGGVSLWVEPDVSVTVRAVYRRRPQVEIRTRPS